MNALRIILPIALGVVAAILNFIVLRGSTAPLELTVFRTEVKADTEVTESMLDKLSVRADREIFKSAVPFNDHGLLLGRRVTRTIGAGEVVLWADLENLDEENIRLYLKPGESTITIPVKPSRIARGLRRGDSIGVLVAVNAPAFLLKSSLKDSVSPTLSRKMLGPFRLLSVGGPSEPSRLMLGEPSLVTVAVMRGAGGKLDPAVAELEEAISSMRRGGNSEGGVLAVEYYEPETGR